MAAMQAPDALGFAQPLAALKTLAEDARADRLQALWSRAERQAAVVAAPSCLREMQDYRGFDETEGWRHAVAHGADPVMQLRLNPALDRGRPDTLLGAVAAQIMPPLHVDRYGKDERLARPLLVAARRRLHGAQEGLWLARITDRAIPAPPAERARDSYWNATSAKLRSLRL